jgi:WhiB family redox-sensing transcriptional regulator
MLPQLSNHVAVEAHERFRLHGVNPADLVAANDEPAEYIARLSSSLRAPWTRDALCIEFDTALWFPTRGQSNQPALEICGRCPVRLECLAEAIDDPELDHGIRGGATAEARKVMRRSRLDGASSLPDPNRCPPRCKCDDCKALRAAKVRAWRRRTGRTGPT